MPDPIQIAVIMAGGAGERFWPLSRQDRPKQLLRLTRPDQTMLHEAVQRIAPLVPHAHLFVATSRALQAPIRAAGLGLDPSNILGEPCKRNTAGCLAWVAAHALARYGREAEVSMAILTADHAIGQEERFRATVATALAAARRENALVTIGITPTRPEVGYGYIEVPEGAAPLAPSVFPVARFREKPVLDDARRFVESGRFYWNSGMFFWTLAAFMEELTLASPDHARVVEAMADALGRDDRAEADRLFATLTDISIDYALMEKARRVLVVRADFEWDDVGALDALGRGWPRDAAGNVTQGDPILIDTRDCIVYNEPGAEAMAVATVGLAGLAVIVTRDGVLVLPRDRAQDVKKIVGLLKERGARQL